MDLKDNFKGHFKMETIYLVARLSAIILSCSDAGTKKVKNQGHPEYEFYKCVQKDRNKNVFKRSIMKSKVGMKEDKRRACGMGESRGQQTGRPNVKYRHS